MAKYIKLYEENPNPKQVAQIVAILKKGGVIIYPTDTVYAIGCDITKNKALERIAKFKKTKLEKAKLSFMCSSISLLSKYIKQIDTNTFRILKHYLPGPFTFILNGNNNLPKAFKNKKTVGIRIPNNNIALAIVEALGNPIVCTSVHDSDKIKDYTTNPEVLLEKWNKLVEVVIDGGIGDIHPSTIIDLCTNQPIILRRGKGEFH